MFIHIYANGESLIPSNPDAKKLFADFREGFHKNDSFSVYEDVAVSGPSAAGGT